METFLASSSQTRSFLLLPHFSQPKRRAARCSPILAVLAKPAPSPENIAGSPEKNGTVQTVYNDSWFDRAAVNYLSKHVQDATGLRNNKRDYASLVQATTDASKKFDVIKQRELVLEALHNAVPRLIRDMIKTLLPVSQFKREYFATFTTIFFVWLVGPCEVRESEFNGKIEKNVVHITKCRLLEETNCVGMCTNLCKVPSQTFIRDSFGMPVNMVPSKCGYIVLNFEDMSCQMVFGEEPPALAQDPAFKQPCYKMCKSKKSHKAECAI